MSNSHLNKARKRIQDAINFVCENKTDFVKNPEKDFTRKSKLPLKEMLQLSLSFGGGSLETELGDYYNLDSKRPSVQGYVQRRDKIKTEAYEYIFEAFTASIPYTQRYKGYRLLACDGTSISTYDGIDRKETYVSHKCGTGYNAMEVDALYDLLNHFYVDVVIKGRAQYDERQSLVDMIERNALGPNDIVMGDRGFESYNVFAHAIEKGCKFLIRIKDINTSLLLSGLDLPDGEFDTYFSKILTRRQTKKTLHSSTYRKLMKATKFDYVKSKWDEYFMHFRVVRIQLDNGSYECLATNLDEQDFSPEDLKELYHLRWGIETSFRDLKHRLGAMHLHAKKINIVKQEIYAKLTVYNFCWSIIMQVNFHKQCKKYMHQINVAKAMNVCKQFLIKKIPKTTDIEVELLRNTQPIRPGRHDERKVKPAHFIDFNYRIA